MDEEFEFDDSVDMGEDFVDDVPDDIPEDIPDDIPEDIPEEEPEIPEEDDLIDDIPEDIPEEEPEIPEEDDLTDDIPEDIPEEELEMPEEDDLTDDIPEDIPEEEPEIPEEDDLIDDIPEDIPEEEPEIPEEDDLTDDIPEDIPEEEPEMPEEDDLTDDIPEDIPEEEPEMPEEDDLTDDIPEETMDEQGDLEDNSSDIDDGESDKPIDDADEDPLDDAEGESADEVDGTDWERTSLRPEDEELLRELDENGEIDIPQEDPELEDPEHTDIHLPTNKTGEFLGEKGNSEFKPSSKDALNRMNQYGRETVDYKDGYPDFSPFTTHDSEWGPINGQAEIGHMTYNRENAAWEFGKRPRGTGHDPNYDLGNFSQADNSIANQMKEKHPDITGEDIAKFRKKNHLTWHECADGKTMQLVPEEIHDACRHSGGVSEMKYRMAWGDITRKLD